MKVQSKSQYLKRRNFLSTFALFNIVEENSLLLLVYTVFLLTSFQMICLKSYRYGNGYFGLDRHLRVKLCSMVVSSKIVRLWKLWNHFLRWFFQNCEALELVRIFPFMTPLKQCRLKIKGCIFGHLQKTPWFLESNQAFVIIGNNRRQEHVIAYITKVSHVLIQSHVSTLPHIPRTWC
jgi:hypothetical protein